VCSKAARGTVAAPEYVSPMFYCPISQTHDNAEIARIREECRRESFWYRACLSPRA
uniref:Uncharacterized protein n=1 Tax=Nothoprocta perdicaria TaxID=30464 RepID=A0A8C6YWD7_NOTPE